MSEEKYQTSNLAVVTLAVGDRGRQLLAVSGPTHAAYARRIGADFHVIGGEPTQPAYPMEDKFRVGQYLQYYDRVIYLDADLMVEPDAPDLFALVPADRVGICDETLYLPAPLPWWEEYHLHDLQRRNGFREQRSDHYYNAGLMVLGREHRHVLGPPTVPYRVYHTAEQDLINLRLLEHAVPVEPLGPDLVWLWFADRDGKGRLRPFRHYAGCGTNGADTLGLMRADAAAVRSLPHTLLSRDRLDDLARLVDQARHLPGDLAELGVYRGGAALLMSLVAPAKTLHLFDTFAGLPEHDQHPQGHHRRGEFACPLDKVKQLLAGRDVQYHAGRFPLDPMPAIDQLAAVHIDLDTFQGTRDAIAWAWPRLVPGGVMVLDDYGWAACPGVERAVGELLPGQTVEVSGQHGWIVKPRPSERVYLINLKRRPDRLRHALEECQKAGITPVVFEAVDGSSAEVPKSFRGGDGGWGCRESHRLVLAECLRDGVERVTVMEDDVELVDGFRERQAEFLRLVPDDWQAVFWGGQHMNPPAEIGPGVLVPNPNRGIHRTHCYTARGPYIRTLHDLFAGADTHIDHVWGDVQRHHKVYAPKQWLAGQHAGRSDINGRELGTRFWAPKAVTRPGRGCTGCGRKGTLR